MELLILPQQVRVALDAGRPILEAALKAGVNLPHSCRGGSCGACRARLLGGEVHYPRGPTLGLSHTGMANGEVLLCQAVALGDVAVEITAIRTPDAVEVKSLPCRVHSLERLTPDVMMVMLRLPAVEPFAFHAGQYLDVLLPDRRRRSFSIASSPDDPSLLELHVRRVEGGAFTPRVFDELTVGALLRIEGPLGRFIYTPASDGILLLVAGGTGFAPLKSMIAMLLKQGLTRPTRLYWGVRRPPDLYQREWLDARLKACPMLSFVPVLSDPGQDSSLWRTGFVHEAVLADHSDLTDAQIYAAGPPAMIEALENGAIARGLAPERFHADVFSYAVDPR